MLTENAQACTHPLAFVRAQRGWSYQKLARVVAKRARDLGVANMAAER
ncbi:transcriptional regulator, partial [Frankia sp. CNm7]|nr:transcriptional regulator [Frankia nepalensis]MBL7514949.1 transcriptional regulator [Frankia nepalensis]MBL7524507.1 transcriptional regulator [Frankia nepalensis]MBL7631444.1 transcriptional regulator [Frankia nepalensis]